MELFYTLLGLTVLYATGHFFLLQNKSYNERTQYEKIVSVFAMIFIALVYLGTMAG